MEEFRFVVKDVQPVGDDRVFLHGYIRAEAREADSHSKATCPVLLVEARTVVQAGGSPRRARCPSRPRPRRRSSDEPSQPPARRVGDLAENVRYACGPSLASHRRYSVAAAIAYRRAATADVSAVVALALTCRSLPSKFPATLEHLARMLACSFRTSGMVCRCGDARLLPVLVPLELFVQCSLSYVVPELFCASIVIGLSAGPRAGRRLIGRATALERRQQQLTSNVSDVSCTRIRSLELQRPASPQQPGVSRRCRRRT